jgi:hypothetical protein
VINKVTRTPTAIYFDAKGKEKKRVPIAGKSWSDIQKYLARLAGKPAPVSRKRHVAKRRVTKRQHTDKTSHGHPA